MKYAADFRQIAREALNGKWTIAVLVGLVATLLGGAGSGGPEVKLNIDGSGAHANFEFAGQTIFSTGGGLNSDIGAFLVGSAIYITIAAIAMAVVYFVLGSIISIGYARFNLDLVDRGTPSFETLFGYFSYWKTAAAARLYHCLLQLRYDRIYSGGTSGPDGQRGHRAIQGNDDRQPLASILPAYQFYWLGYPLCFYTGDRQPVAAPL